MTLYEAYKKKKFDLTMFGLERGAARSDYFCTPVGARAIGWTGVDGIHYCMIRGFEEMVFCIAPMAGQGDFVHPVAANFRDFVCLILACGGEAALSQAYAWNREQFQEFIKAEAQTDEKLQMAKELKEIYSLLPMEAPYDYIKELQAQFDYRKLRFKKIYYEWAPEEPIVPTAPEWRVYYHGDFFSREGKEGAGAEIRVDKQFQWGELCWNIPAVYSCTSGLVMDLCASMDEDLLKKYEERVIESAEEQERVDFENPLNMQVSFEVQVNGQKLRYTGGCGLTWIPNEPGQPEWNRESRWILEHYGYDLKKAWLLHRVKLEWTEKKPEIQSLVLTIVREPAAIPGGHFSVKEMGERVMISHPLTGVEYQLKVEEIVQERLPKPILREDLEFPECYTKLVYALTPELPDTAFRIMDCASGDCPRQKPGAEHENNRFAASIGIIGGAAGPTAVTLNKADAGTKLWIVCSSLHFEPVERVEWRISFMEKLLEDITVKLIGD